jgi:hypothetical protein
VLDTLPANVAICGLQGSYAHRCLSRDPCLTHRSRWPACKLCARIERRCARTIHLQWDRQTIFRTQRVRCYQGPEWRANPLPGPQTASVAAGPSAPPCSIAHCSLYICTTDFGDAEAFSCGRATCSVHRLHLPGARVGRSSICRAVQGKLAARYYQCPPRCCSGRTAKRVAGFWISAIDRHPGNAYRPRCRLVVFSYSAYTTQWRWKLGLAIGSSFGAHARDVCVVTDFSKLGWRCRLSSRDCIRSVPRKW